MFYGPAFPFPQGGEKFSKEQPKSAG